MKIKIFPSIICRTPAFSLQNTLKHVWEELKSKIKESSPAFYELIKDENSSTIDSLPEKTKFTIWKYMNRAKYRATPFGSFAAVSILPLVKTKSTPIVDQQQFIHHFIDWGEKEKHIPKKIGMKTILLANSSVYKLADEIRYVRYSDGHFELGSVDAFDEITALLDYCRYKISLKQLYILMLEKFELSSIKTKKLVSQLISLQLLITDNDPNITGTDYFQRLNISIPNSSSDYIISERKISTGGIEEEKLKNISLLVNFLQENLPLSENKDLLRFKLAFNKKFEQRAVSLALVMDPEAGIGYGNLEQLKEEDSLIAELKLTNNNQSDNELNYSNLHRFLLNKISIGQTIKLEEFNSDIKNRLAKLPNTFSVMFHIFEGSPVIESIGGCTANALLGRFTLIGDNFTSVASQIADIEQRANPKISFFDIAYQVENHIDNVNRRKRIYPNELPLLTYPEEKNPLNFEDILVSLKRDEIILTSKTLGQRIIPRIPSAYNYTRSDLAVYRFLCDLQHQSLATNLNFKLSHFFKGLIFYPRVCYANIIVSPAMWLLPKKFLTKTIIKLERNLLEIKLWLKTQQINFLFRTGVADHMLCFDPNSDDDLSSFLSYCNQYNQTELYIEEALIKPEDGIVDEKSQNYAPQYVASYFHEEQIYAPAKTKTTAHPTKTDIKLPGEDWLYFDIYSHPSRTNSLLLNEINRYINENEEFINKWFFIRYTDPSAHIRLRLHLKDHAPGFEIIHILMNLIKPKLLDGFVTDFNIKTYYRETQRYGAERMDLVECFFHQDSTYIVMLLSKARENEQLYASCLLLFGKYCAHIFPDINNRILFVKQMAANFSAEMNMIADQFKKINASYHRLKQNFTTLALDLPKKNVKEHERVFKKVMNNCNEKIEREQLFADLIHMHVNRLFKTDQRMHETIIYQYLLLALKTQKAFSSN